MVTWSPWLNINQVAVCGSRWLHPTGPVTFGGDMDSWTDFVTKTHKKRVYLLAKLCKHM